MMHIRSLLSLLALAISALSLAQDRPEITFGKVSDSDRAMNAVPGDSTADAYVLFKAVSLDFEYSDHNGPSLTERYHHRIKLLHPSSFERADVVLAFHREYESISEVEAIIHLPTGGSILIPRDQISEESLGDREEAIKFTFPRVEAGAIIEYRYLHRRKSILMPSTFYFQEDIPVRWAQYTAMIPPYYRYVTLTSNALDVNESKLTPRTWGPRFNTGAYSGQQKIDHGDIFWAMQDVPAAREQPYSNNAIDHLPQVRLQLQEVEYPTGGKHSIFGNWLETAEELQGREDFGKYYRNKINYSQVWKAAEPYLTHATTDRERIAAAYAFVNEHFNWNGNFGILASASPNRVYNDRGTGNSADLNMALLALLNEMGIEATPLLVSLRNTGAPIEQYPLLEQFNHLMVYVEVEGKPVFLDAGASDRPVGLPRELALNHRGWIADRKDPRWTDIVVSPSRLTVLADIQLAAGGRAAAQVKSRMEQYYAFEGRSALNGISDDANAPLVHHVRRVFPDTRVVAYRALEAKEGKPDQLDYELELEMEMGQVVDDYLYVQPIILPLLDGELADVLTRDLPIDFPFPWQQRYIANLTLPEGYVLEDAPEAIRVRAEDGSIVANYSVDDKVPGLLQVVYSVQLDRTLYSADEYPALRDMFRRVIEIQQTPIVLKRAK